VIAHVVQFITKPGAAADLQSWIRKAVVPELMEKPNFIDLFLMVAEGEPRVCLAVSLWQEGSAAYAWEKSAVAGRSLASLVDVKSTANRFQISGSGSFRSAERGRWGLSAAPPPKKRRTGDELDSPGDSDAAIEAELKLCPQRG